MRSPTHSPRFPWYRRRPDVLALVIIVGLSALVALLIFGPLFLMVISSIFGLSGAGCSSNERVVLEEFSHYGDQQASPYSAEVSCNASYTTNATRDEILGHYDQQLRENGWEVIGVWAANPPQGIEVFGEQLSDISKAPEEGVRAGLGARRGDYTLGITYHPPGESPEFTSDKAGVLVEVTDEPTLPGGKGGFPK